MKSVLLAAAIAIVLPVPALAAEPASGPARTPAASVVVAPNYVIGPDDVLEISYWREKELSAEVVVRPDGRIALPLIGEVEAIGLTPVELTDRVKSLARELLEFPVLTVAVKQINSRKVVITGEVAKPGRYPLAGPTTVIELIAMAGGLSDFADQKNIGVLRVVDGRRVSFKVNYKKLARLENLDDNIALLPGDIVVVP